jgi:hypothetical protein
MIACVLTAGLVLAEICSFQAATPGRALAGPGRLHGPSLQRRNVFQPTNPIAAKIRILNSEDRVRISDFLRRFTATKEP